MNAPNRHDAIYNLLLTVPSPAERRAKASRPRMIHMPSLPPSPATMTAGTKIPSHNPWGASMEAAGTGAASDAAKASSAVTAAQRAGDAYYDVAAKARAWAGACQSTGRANAGDACLLTKTMATSTRSFGVGSQEKGVVGGSVKATELSLANDRSVQGCGSVRREKPNIARAIRGSNIVSLRRSMVERWPISVEDGNEDRKRQVASGTNAWAPAQGPTTGSSRKRAKADGSQEGAENDNGEASVDDPGKEVEVEEETKLKESEAAPGSSDLTKTDQSAPGNHAGDEARNKGCHDEASKQAIGSGPSPCSSRHDERHHTCQKQGPYQQWGGSSQSGQPSSQQDSPTSQPSSRWSSSLTSSCNREHDPQYQIGLRNKQRRLLLLYHAATCPHKPNPPSASSTGSSCGPAHHDKGLCTVTPHCAQFKHLWQHMATCKDNKCKVKHCFSSRCVLSHYRKCKDKEKCPTCSPVVEGIYSRIKAGNSALAPFGAQRRAAAAAGHHHTLLAAPAQRCFQQGGPRLAPLQRRTLDGRLQTDDESHRRGIVAPSAASAALSSATTAEHDGRRGAVGVGTVYCIVVPPGVRPGDAFRVAVGPPGAQVVAAVRCPPGALPGDELFASMEQVVPAAAAHRLLDFTPVIGER